MDKLPDAESDAYFHSRPRGSQMGAIVSPQSTVLHNGRQELEQRDKEMHEVSGDMQINSECFCSLFVPSMCVWQSAFWPCLTSF